VASDWDLELPYRRAEDINRSVFRALDETSRSRAPVFLFVNYLDAHWPYAPPPPFDARFAGGCEPFDWYRYLALEKAVSTLQRTIGARERDCLAAQYDGGIAYLDSRLGQVFERLKRLGLYDQSLLIVTSDHGEAFGARNLMSHGVSVYQNQVHVPLIVHYPGQQQGTVVGEYVSLVDLMPTVLDIVGQPRPAALAGVSLRSVPTAPARQIVSESFPHVHFVDMHPRFRRVQRALFEGPEKLITSTLGQQELYDLSNDPEEQVNLWRPGNAETLRLSSALNQWLQRYVAGRDTGTKTGSDAVRRLQSLGYIQ
jgi:arylsulfatase A-like enzyme